jgi:hypothetical protein
VALVVFVGAGTLFKVTAVSVVVERIVSKISKRKK